VPAHRAFRVIAMKTRTKIGISIWALIIFGLILFVCISLPSQGISEENFHRVECGMTLSEVENILGPANWDGTIPDELNMRLIGECVPKTPQIGSSSSWATNELVITVDFGARSEVIRCSLAKRREREESILDNIRRWLRLPWW